MKYLLSIIIVIHFSLAYCASFFSKRMLLYYRASDEQVAPRLFTMKVYKH